MYFRNILIAVFATTLLAGCGGDNSVPKPQAYLRIDLPEHYYCLPDTLRQADGDLRPSGGRQWDLPFVFEASTRVEWREKEAPKGERWVDLMYPQWDAVVYLTYKRLHNADSLRGQIDTSSRMLERHYRFATGIDEQVFESDDHTVHAVKWLVKGGKVASTFQFYATDSARHFLRGALFVNRIPNNDSLAPVLDYIHRDLDHLIETLRWR